MNLVRIKCLSQLVCAMCKVQTVNFSKLKKVAFPILFNLLNKRGNSNCEERIEIMQRFIRLFGRESITCLVADREFIGEEWVKWLNDWDIEYHLRVKENFWIEDPRTGEGKRVKSMFIHLKDKPGLALHRIYRIKGQLCYLSGERLKNSYGVPELQILISFSKPDLALSRYKERWHIETCFRGMKSSGFNIEDTHLVHLERVEQLFAVMIISFTWAYLVDITKNIEVKAIRTLKTGNRAISVMKYGLEHIASVLLYPFRPQSFDIFKILSCA